ncbi:Retrovirus-related Pol polyprotein from transposon 412 family [Gossypium australe]|uniref:Retrovirus-related Pol polyprotein from transposon 412 family n=1 Tax=Gossypium australe TaxID=47621 RepID=A0A5B6VTE0_9ROSI|nr:Retrovirus-related Pol polyprotein from transposon 412 family [Gossypium australe]
MMQMNELDEWRTEAYENSKLYNEATKRRHDARLKRSKQFEVGDLVLLYNSKLKLFPGKLKSRWSGPFMIKTIFPYGTIEVTHPTKGTFKVNGHRLKLYNSTDIGDMREALTLHEPTFRTENRERTMSTSRIKRSAPSKKRKGPGSSFTSATTENRHPFLWFPQATQEEKYKAIRRRSIGTGRCIDWNVVRQVGLELDIKALLSTEPWENFFKIDEPTYMELTLEFCTTFILQSMTTQFDHPGAIQFRLGGSVHRLSIPQFGTALGLYTSEFIAEYPLAGLHRELHRIPIECWHALRPTTNNYNLSRSKATALHPALSPALQPLQLRRANLLPQLMGNMVPQGIQTMLHMRMIKQRRGTNPPQYTLKSPSTEEEDEDIPDDVSPPSKEATNPSQYPHRAAKSLTYISARLDRFEMHFAKNARRFDGIEAALQQICQHLHISSSAPPPDPTVDEGL